VNKRRGLLVVDMRSKGAQAYLGRVEAAGFVDGCRMHTAANSRLRAAAMPFGRAGLPVKRRPVIA